MPEFFDVQAVETAICAKLPDDFVKFQLEREVSDLEPRGLYVPEIDECIVFEGLLESRHIIDDLSFIREVLGAPEQVISFAADGCGNRAFLDMTEEGYGSVFLLVEDIPPPISSPGGFFRVASTFTEFLEKLIEPPEDE